jgi:hypothetical protein
MTAAMDNNDHEGSSQAVEALNLLPSLLQDKRGSMRKPQAQKSVLESLVLSIDPLQLVLDRGQALRQTQVSHRKASDRQDNPTRNKHDPSRRAVELIKVNRPSAAVQVLERSDTHDVISSWQPCPKVVAASLQLLHPPASKLDELPIATTTLPPPLSLSHLDICGCLIRLPARSAAGMSSWTYDLIIQLLTGDDRLIALVTSLFNLLLSGKGGPPGLWTKARLIALQKKDGGIRPIAIGEVWLRFFSRVVAGKLSKTLGQATI